MPDAGGGGGERQPRKRAREIIFNERDEAIFTLALQQRFPDVTFTAEHREMFGGNRPCASIALSDSSVVLAMIDRQWSPDLYLHIRRSCWNWGWNWIDPSRWGWDPPTLDPGSIGSSYLPGDDVARRFIQTVWRIIARIATNRAQSGSALVRKLNDMDNLTMAEASGHLYWCGHQALAWCREGGERRMLHGAARPRDDWEIPKDPWYQDLMRRAMDTEGWTAKTLPGWRDAGD